MKFPAASALAFAATVTWALPYAAAAGVSSKLPDGGIPSVTAALPKDAKIAPSATTSATALSSASPAPAPAAGPCQALEAALPTGSLDLGPYLAAASCLRKEDSLTGRGPDPFLKSRLTDNKNWYLSQLDRFRSQRDIPRALDMAYLAEAKAIPDPNLYRLLADIYGTASDPYHAGLAFFREAELDSVQAGYIQYQLDNLIHTAASDIPAPRLLDSLTNGFHHTHHRTADILETVCWNNRYYPGAFRNFLASLALFNPGPGVALDRAHRFQTLGYWDFADSILEKISWRNLPHPWLAGARSQFLAVRAQLQDWPAIISEPTLNQSPALGEEETFDVATAYLKSGKPDIALEKLKRLDENADPPWGFRAELLRAQALMAQGKNPEAARTLDALKKNPHRTEGTGPILFWQSCLALQEDRFASAESLLVLASAYTGSEEAQRALDYRFFMLLDTGESRKPFFRGLAESPLPAAERAQALDRVTLSSGLWPFARLEKAQILLVMGKPDSAKAVLEDVSKRSPDRLAGLEAEAKAAFLLEKTPGGRQSALVRYEDLLIKYQQGVIPEFSRGRIRALK